MSSLILQSANIKINIPHVHEQKKISNLLRKIDDTIALHQRKLDQLKELKKAYLQLMFPKKD
ncbi:restriction endonuclease subunit S, partial [Enterococcus faecalis]|uniref:restriction endonuclease subunit S n=1 Tax=Enterococcus faecalis TaxID=1351 RepID=UPI0025B084CD